MTTIVTRTGKGSPLTHVEVDTNFTNLNTAKLEAGAIALGSAAAPSISFVSDTNTGIFSPGADQVAISSNGTSRLSIDASGNVAVNTNTLYVDAVNNRVAIGTNVPGTLLDVALVRSSATHNTAFFGTTGTGVANDINRILIKNVNTASGQNFGVGIGGVLAASASNQAALAFYYDNGSATTEGARIDSSGRLLVGTTTGQTFAGNSSGAKTQVGADNDYAGIAVVSAIPTAIYPSHLTFAKTRGTTTSSRATVNNNDEIGLISFQGADGSNFIRLAGISGEVDGTPGANDMPGRLVFSTTADGSASPTERMRIKSDGDVSIVTGNLIIGTAGKGIDFSATANGSGTMTNELLSDYEEGTWLPNVGGTATYSSQSGFYTKIGNIVHVQCTFTINVIGTGDTSRLFGLPFPSANLSTVQSICVGYYNGLANSITWLSGYVENNASTLQFAGNSTAATTIQSNGLVLFANSTNIIFSASYRAA